MRMSRPAYCATRASAIRFLKDSRDGHIMDIPLELAFHNMTPSDSLKSAVEREVERLERFYDHIVGCRVVIEMPHKRHRLGSNVPDVHVVLRVPGREIVVSRELTHAGNKKSAVNAYAVLK